MRRRFLGGQRRDDDIVVIHGALRESACVCGEGDPTSRRRVVPQALTEQELAIDRDPALVFPADLDPHVVPDRVRVRALCTADRELVDIQLEVIVPRSAKIDAQSLLAGPNTNRATLVNAAHATNVEVDRVVDPRGVAGVEKRVRLLFIREIGTQDAVTDTPRRLLVAGPPVEIAV